jgi:hypothetical protein
VVGGAPLRKLCSVPLQRKERCVSMMIYRAKTRKGFVGHLVVGTCSITRRGEDTVCPGRLIIYRVRGSVCRTRRSCETPVSSGCGS